MREDVNQYWLPNKWETQEDMDARCKREDTQESIKVKVPITILSDTKPTRYKLNRDEQDDKLFMIATMERQLKLNGHY